MTIYADPSFLVSLLYVHDAGHAAAAAVYGRHPADEWQTSEWSRFETVNSLRQLCRKYPTLKPEIPEALRRYFKQLHRRGTFIEVETDLEQGLQECQQLSAAHSAALTMRSADVLHVALLDQIQPDLFVTRDAHQSTLAGRRGFRLQLVP